MAQNTSNEELKQQALGALAEGREEIMIEVIRMRQQLSPVRVLKRVVDRHAGLVVGLAVVIPALLIFRARRSSPLMMSVANPPAKPVVRSLLLGAAGLLTRFATPALIKYVIRPHVQDYMAKKHPGTAACTPQV